MTSAAERIDRRALAYAPRTSVMGRSGTLLARVHLPVAVLLYLVAVVFPANFNLGPLSMNAVRLLLLLMIVPMSVRLLSGAYGKVMALDVLFLLHFFWIVVALAVNNPAQVISNAGSTGIEFLGGYMLGRAGIRSREDFIALARTLGIICMFLLPFVIHEAVTGQKVLLRMVGSLPGIRPIDAMVNEKRMGLTRVQAVFAHPIHSGLFFILCFSLCFIGLKDYYSPTKRWLFSVGCAIGGFLALSSGAFLALVLQIGLIFWAWIFRNDKARWWYLLALFGFFYVLISLLSTRSPIMVFLSYATFSADTAYWRALIFEFGMQNVWANPIFGIGLNEWFRPSFMVTSSVDNFWLLVTMRYGIPGFVFLAIGYVWTLWKIGTRNFDTDPMLWNLRRAWMFSFIGLTFTICTVHIWATIYSFCFFMFGAGIWMLQAEPRAENTGAEDTEPAAAGAGQKRLVYTRFAQSHHRRS